MERDMVRQDKNNSNQWVGSTKAAFPHRMTFPYLLHGLLSEAETIGIDDVISWHPSGAKFVIHRPNEFVHKVLPRCFRQTKLQSFKRQLNAYGFQREMTSQADYDKLTYTHKIFHRDDASACRRIERRKPPSTRPSTAESPPKQLQTQAILDQQARRYNQFRQEGDMISSWRDHSARLKGQRERSPSQDGKHLFHRTSPNMLADHDPQHYFPDLARSKTGPVASDISGYQSDDDCTAEDMKKMPASQPALGDGILDEAAAIVQENVDALNNSGSNERNEDHFGDDSDPLSDWDPNLETLS